MGDELDLSELTGLISNVLQRGGFGEVSPDQLAHLSDGVDLRTWNQLQSAGVLELGIPELKGGAGFGVREVAGVSEVLGGRLYPSPFLNARVMVGTFLDLLGGEAATEQLKLLMTGSRRGAMAVPSAANLEAVTADAHDGQRATLTGTLNYIPDAIGADYFIVIAAENEVFTAHLVAADADGMSIVRENPLDVTRPLVSLRMDGASASTLRGVMHVREAVISMESTFLTAVAGEQLGGARKCLEMATLYAKTRTQFGQSIGSFQAIKHTCANMALDVRRAEAAVRHAVNAHAGSNNARAAAAHLAYATTADVYSDVTRSSIQVLGGVGFTWEHSAHLYLKRAMSTAALVGDPTDHREKMLQAAGF